MDSVISPPPDTPALIDWKLISESLAQVVTELTILTSQFNSMNSRIAKIESTLALQNVTYPPATNTKSPSYIPSSMQGWDDNLNNSNNNILVDVGSPPLQSTSGSIPIPQFTPMSPSCVTPNSTLDMKQRLSSLADTVTKLSGSIKQGIEQNNLILARQNGQANH
ncbi:unnamed protein product [Rhizophagus irregularis]|nr:unnamed protein product [Rhizophagus irregularis]